MLRAPAVDGMTSAILLLLSAAALTAQVLPAFTGRWTLESPAQPGPPPARAHDGARRRLGARRHVYWLFVDLSTAI